MNTSNESRYIFAFTIVFGIAAPNLRATQLYWDAGTPDSYAKRAHHALIDQQNRAEQDANIQAAADMQALTAQFNARISADRARFWQLYPDKSGFEDARKTLNADLFDKDRFYIAQPENKRTIKQLGPDAVDGGIPLGAVMEFSRWGDAIFDDEYPNHDPMGTIMKTLNISMLTAGAISRTQKYYDAYVIERDWCEFDAAHRNPAGCEDPEFYGAMLCQRWEKRTLEDSYRQYNDMRQVLGTDALIPALTTVRDAAKDEYGQVANLDALGFFFPNVENMFIAGPPGKSPSDSEPLSMVVDLATMHDPRLHAIAALAKASPQVDSANQKSRTPYGNLTRFKYDWKDGEKTYNQWVAAVGADAVQKVSAALLASSYNADGTAVVDLKPEQGGYKPADYFNFTLRDVNGDKGRMRFTLAQMLNLTTSGAIDEKYNQLVATYGEPALFAAGQNYWQKGDAVQRVDYHSDYDVLQAFLDKKIKFNAQGRVDNGVENPEFLAWKNFPVGTRVSAYECRWYSSSMTYPYTWLCRSLDAVANDHVELKGEGWPVQRKIPGQTSQPTGHTYAATVHAKVDITSTNKTLAEGDEMVPVGNFQIRCHWMTVADGKDPNGKDAKKTTWKSDLVPGGVVRIYGISHSYDSGGEYQWSLLSVDPVPASFSVPDNGAPLTPSGLVDMVPPFPDGVPPSDPIANRPPVSIMATAPMARSNPGTVQPTQPTPNPPAQTPGAASTESQPDTAAPSPAQASLALSSQSKTMLAIIKKSSHFAGTAPQPGFANWQIQAELDWDDANQTMTGWIYFPQLKSKKRWEGRIVQDSAKTFLRMKETAVIDQAPGSNALLGITYSLYPVQGGFRGDWVDADYNGKILLSPVAR